MAELPKTPKASRSSAKPQARSGLDELSAQIEQEQQPDAVIAEPLVAEDPISLESLYLERHDLRPDLSSRPGQSTEPRAIPEPASTSLAEQAFATEAPAVATAVVQPTELSAFVEGYTRTGVFGSQEHYAPRASAFIVNREVSGRVVITEKRPSYGGNWAKPPMVFAPSIPGANGEAEVRSQVSRYIAGEREATDTKNLPMLVLIDGMSDADEFTEQLARDANALVVLIEYQDGLAAPIFKSKPVTPAVKAAVNMEPQTTAEDVLPEDGAHVLPGAFFESDAFKRQVASHPERVRGPGGEWLNMSYGLKDERGPYVVARGWAENIAASTVRELEVRMNSGVVVPLGEVRFRV